MFKAAMTAAALHVAPKSVENEAVATSAVAVVFKCNNPRCIVGLKIKGLPGFSFVGQHGMTLPSGTRLTGWKVTSQPSGEGFSVTVSPGSFDPPIAGTTGPNSGGITDLTV